MDRDAGLWGADMLSYKVAGAAQLLDRAVQIETCIWHFPPAFRGHDKCRADTAINIELVVGHRGTGVKAGIIKSRFLRIQMGGQRLQHARTIMKTHGAQSRAAFGNRIVQTEIKRERGLTRTRNLFAGDRAFDPSCRCIGRQPLACDKTVNVAHRHLSVTLLMLPHFPRHHLIDRL